MGSALLPKRCTSADSDSAASRLLEYVKAQSAPAPQMARTIARPMPLVQPVMIATLLESEFFFRFDSRLSARFCSIQLWKAYQFQPDSEVYL
jgi:hypothetical protein